MTLTITRREVAAAIGGAAAWPLAAHGQQRTMPVIGFLSSSAPADRARYVTAFRQGVREAGYVEGQTVTIEYRWAQEQYDQLPNLVADLVRLRVAVIVTEDTLSAIAAKAATTTIPIVFGTGGDPVRDGLVASLNRPGGNVTGVSFILAELGAKQLGLMHELLPRATRIAVLGDPKWPITELFVSDVRAAASAIGRQIELLDVSSSHEIDAVFARLAQRPPDALLISPSPLTNNRRVQLVTRATYHRVPAIYALRDAAEAGGLMSYGTNLADGYRQIGMYTGQILKGEKATDLPVIQSTKIEFVINLNTATAFGLTVPPTLLAIADEVIE
jgi:putative ABC transport system substrate-binding protein